MISFVADKNKKLSRLAMESAQGLSYSALNKALRKKDIKVNGKRVAEDITLSIGDNVQIYVDIEKIEKLRAVFFDDNIIVIDKKSGFTAEEIFEELKEQYNEVYFIHRLDRNTSGIMIFARNNESERELINGFKNHTFEKYYLARVIGVPKKKSAILEGFLFKDEKKKTVTITEKKVKGSVPIKTGYEVIEDNGDTSLLKVRLYTGKTHQIRSHLAYIGHAIVGDGKYGNNAFNRKEKQKRQQLQSHSITLHFDENSPLYYLNGKTFTAPKSI